MSTPAARIGDHQVTVAALRTDDDSGLVTTASRTPLLRWRLAAERTTVLQRAYEIERSDDPEFRAIRASIGRVDSEMPIAGQWPGEPLRSREVTWCRARVWTDKGATGWSSPLRVEAGLFEPADWTARPISPMSNVGIVEPRPAPILRRSFRLDRVVASARLYVTALGVHELWINGQEVSDALFDPGWTNYHNRLLYSSYDVTSFLRRGENVIAASVGDGWWRGNLTWLMNRAVYGDTTALLAQLELVLTGGEVVRLGTDEAWRGSTGAIRSADFYDGCDTDITLDPIGWHEAGFDDSLWEPVTALPLPAGLEQRSAPPVRMIDRFAVAACRDSQGRLIVDCGQNLTGYLRISGRAATPARIIVRHAEVLEPGGALHTAALRQAKATDTYRIDSGRFDLAPSFTYHGFRYAELIIEGDIDLDQIEVCVISSDLRETGEFRCSDERINQLYSNIRWSQRGNFISIPTDCPQRDERLGWAGDIQVFGDTACINQDARAFLGSWLTDLASEQAGDGQVPSVVPNVIQGHPFEYGGIGWADAATLLPWTLYEAYGDKAILRRQFASMCAWVDWCASRLDDEDIWRGDFQLGDWLDPGAPLGKPWEATTDRDFIASAYLVRSAARTSAAAALLGKPELSARYGDLSERVARATWRHWQAQALQTQAGCAIAIMFEIAPEDQVAMVGARLADLVVKSEGRIATGFLGTPLVLPALTKSGQDAAAFRLLLNESAPGWLYQVKNGATTMWERWDAMLPDGSINGGEIAADDSSGMLSFNHYAYGAVGAWLFGALAGIGLDERYPGYRMIRFQPCLGGGITTAQARIDTSFGPAAIAWSVEDNRLIVELDVPAGAEGQVHTPDGWSREIGSPGPMVGSGRHRFSMYRPRADPLPL